MRKGGRDCLRRGMDHWIIGGGVGHVVEKQGEGQLKGREGLLNPKRLKTFFQDC